MTIWNKLKNFQITGEKLYFCALDVCLVLFFIMNSTFFPFWVIPHFNINWIAYVMILLLFFKLVFFDSQKWWVKLLLLLCLLVSVVSWRHNKMMTLVVTTALVISAQNINFRRVIKHYLVINSTMLIGSAIYSVVGIIENLVYVRNGIHRFSLGVDYPTDLAAYFFYLLLAYCFYKGTQLKWIEYVVFLFGNVLLYRVTNARLDVIAIFAAVVLIFIAQKADLGKRWATVISKCFWPFLIIMPYGFWLLTVYFDPSSHIYQKLNLLLSGRLALGWEAINKYGYKLFGQYVYENGWGGVKGKQLFEHHPGKYFFIDSSVIRMLVVVGLILSILVLITLLIISLRSTLNHDFILPAILLVIMLSSLIDHHLLDITYNPFLIALFAKNTADFRGGDNNEESDLSWKYI